MSAITPFLEQQDDPAETEEDRLLLGASDSRTLAGFRSDPDDVEPRYEVAERVVNGAHAKLVATAWTREAVHEAIAGQTMTLEDRDGELMIVLDKKFGAGPAFNRYPPNQVGRDSVPVLGWTSKMGCPSFSLPAGPPGYGGSCPGSIAGQSIVPISKLVRSSAERVEEVLNEPVNLSECVCQICYAEGGFYRYASKQLYQVVLYAWTQQAVADGSFVEALDWAVKNADFKLDAYTNKKKVTPAETRGKFFRLHDSGDFYSYEYLQAWKDVADLNPDVTFWAPSRMWAFPKGIEWVNEINAEPRNLIIRPSQYMVNRPAPSAEMLGDGWVAWTTVYGKNVKPEGPFIESGDPYNWDCQAYAVKDEAHSCRAAEAPDGETGCRACWIEPEMSVNYTQH